MEAERLKLRIVPLLLQLGQFSYPSWKVIVSASRGHNYKSRAFARLFFACGEFRRAPGCASGAVNLLQREADNSKQSVSTRFTKPQLLVAEKRVP